MKILIKENTYNIFIDDKLPISQIELHYPYFDLETALKFEKDVQKMVAALAILKSQET